jgi:hypothetical protein
MTTHEGKLTGEASRETRDTSERRFKRLLHVMIRVVLEDLYHCDPRLRFVVDLSFATQGEDLIVLVHAIGHMRKRLAINASIRVDCHEKTNLIEGELQVIKGVLDGLVQLVQFPAVMKSIQQTREKQLRITLAAIACAGATSLTWQTTFH